MVIGALRRRHSVAFAYMDGAYDATVGRYYIVLAGLGADFARIELFHFQFLLVPIVFIGFPSIMRFGKN